MKPSQNFFCGALALNEPKPLRYHSPTPGCRIEYHIAASVDFPLEHWPAAFLAWLAAGASRSAQTPRVTRIERMSGFLPFFNVASAAAARAIAELAGAPRVADPDLRMSISGRS